MATERKHSVIIFIIISIITILGIISGIILNKPLITVLVILPAVLYELFWIKGIFSKLISILSFIVLLAEIYTIIAGISVDISKMFGGYFTSFSGISYIHAGLIGAVILVILAIYLFKGALGFYTKGLSIIILLSSMALFYTINPVIIPSADKSHDIQENIKKEIQI